MNPVAINIGKNGLTEQVLSEIKSHLIKNKQVKVRVLKSARDTESTKEISLVLSKKLRCNVADVRGHVIILEK